MPALPAVHRKIPFEQSSTNSESTFQNKGIFMKTMTRSVDAQLAEQQSSLRCAGVGVTRREFLTATIAAGLVAGVTGPTWAAESNDEMPRRDLGRTGERISAIGLGGFHI